MNRQITETIIGALVILVASYFFLTAYGKSGKSMEESYVVHASFSDITGVNSGSDVRISGVKIGTVESINLDPDSYQATVTMLINNSVKIPEDSSAAIVGESLLGGKFIAIGIGGAEEMLANSGKIGFTQPSVSLEQLLGKFVFSGGGVDAQKTEQPETGAPEDKSTETTPSHDDEIKLTVP